MYLWGGRNVSSIISLIGWSFRQWILYRIVRFSLLLSWEIEVSNSESSGKCESLGGKKRHGRKEGGNERTCKKADWESGRMVPFWESRLIFRYFLPLLFPPSLANRYSSRYSHSTLPFHPPPFHVPVKFIDTCFLGSQTCLWVVYTTPRGFPGSALAPHCLHQTSYPL